MLLYYAHLHYHTAPPNRQQLQGKAILAQDVPYSRGTHNGNSMAIPTHIVPPHIVGLKVEVIKEL